ncbi:adenylyl cyclase-associated protein [Anaeramoeba ignava]|uniref:Adenylyl cyclase-associated protein n=1 Tax=Anaeramoeba ignava TaxID=1746090 RepID=A0A9Q0LN39_ANAIG|nr:adenylyl cyclase-associated protein [Anaeramoeba ignava]|eukprot:Anaeramoba_ignava/a351864_1063.p1 GENE.a351864_1063~~a351864_1063.p1  ORF type:complete len:212 (-),score=65.16 a351864_1063:115-750(-)
MDKLDKIVARLEEITKRLEIVEQKLSGKTGEVKPTTTTRRGPDPVGGWNEQIGEPLNKLMELSKKLGGEVQEIATIFKEGIDAELELVKKAQTMNKPSMEQLQPLLTPISEKIMKSGQYKDSHRRNSKFLDYIMAVSEGMGILGWVAVEPAPAPFAEDMSNGGIFYGNKIMMANKNKNQDNYDWGLAVNSVYKAFVPYIKQYHTTGLSWKK